MFPFNTFILWCRIANKVATLVEENPFVGNMCGNDLDIIEDLS